MTILVAGGQRVDAGKTTFATGLVSRLDTVGYKPRAGNDYWFDHDDVRAAVNENRLYGKDANRLVEAAGDGRPPEAVNAVHRVWTPTPGPGSGILGRTDREFLLDRVGEQFVVNGTRDLPALLREQLELADAHLVESLTELNEAMTQYHLPLLAEMGKTITTAERPVVESYSDVAMPLRQLAPDAVAVVEPSRVQLYDGERWRRACEVAAGGPGDGRLETRTDAVADLVDPVTVARVSPLPDAQRADPAATAEAYAELYDELLAVADD